MKVREGLIPTARVSPIDVRKPFSFAAEKLIVPKYMYDSDRARIVRIRLTADGVGEGGG